ncbi:MAG: GNAT family N-acetyltransferase [Candidatus Nanopelagicales bacterium]|nr:GNAT family N-acetyltransferase [Candidatus Nanopelagicales bacterium]
MSRFTAPSPLSCEHETAEFDCGQQVLGEWLRKYALTNQSTGSARSFVACLSGTNRVVGFYALSTGVVIRNEAPGRIAKGMPDPIPVILLGRLAVDRKEHHHGLGSGLLRDAITRVVQVADTVGVRAILVHAMNEEARDFYLRHDFDPSPIHDDHLMLLMKDAPVLLRNEDQ